MVNRAYADVAQDALKASQSAVAAIGENEESDNAENLSESLISFCWFGDLLRIQKMKSNLLGNPKFDVVRFGQNGYTALYAAARNGSSPCVSERSHNF